MNFIMLQGIAAVIVGLVWLFFTKKSKGKVVKNWRWTCWALMGLWLVGSWT